MASDVVVLGTDVWGHIFATKRKPHPDAAKWKEMLIGRTVVIAVQTRAEVLAGVLLSNWGPDRKRAVLNQLDATATIPTDEGLIQRFAQLTADAITRGDALGSKDHIGDRWIAATALACDASLLALDRIYRSDPDLVLLNQGESNV